MEDHGISNQTNHGNQFFTVQDENLQNLEILLTSLAGEDIGELHKLLPAEWSQLEELEQQVWAAFFPASSPHYAAAHRMTMSRIQTKQ